LATGLAELRGDFFAGGCFALWALTLGADFLIGSFFLVGIKMIN